MTWNDMKDLWRHVTRRVKSLWANSPYGDVGKLAVKRRQLIDKLNARYGVLKHDAEKQMDGLVAKLSIKTSTPKHEKVDHVS